jgi:hypothetical protein
LVATNAQITGKIIAGTGSSIDWSYIQNVLVQTAQIADLAVTNAKIASLDAGKISTGYLSAARLDTTVAYITNSAMIANAVIQTAHIGDLQVTDAKIASGLSATKITTGTLDASVVNVTNLNATNITTGTLNAIKVTTSSGYTRIELNPTNDALFVYYSNIIRAKLAGFGLFFYDSAGNESCQIIGTGSHQVQFSNTDKFTIVNYLGSEEIVWDGSQLYCDPTAANLGSATYKWGNLYLSGNIYVDGTVDGIDISAHAANASAHHSSTSNGLYITPAQVVCSGLVQGASLTITGAYAHYIANITIGAGGGYDILPYGDNYGSLGYRSGYGGQTSNRRWSQIHGVTIVSGDFKFENKFRITEEGKTGIAFFNQRNKKIAILDDEGNLFIKGNIYKL